MSKSSNLWLWLLVFLLYSILAIWIFFFSCWCLDCDRNNNSDQGASATYEAVEAPIVFNSSDTIANTTDFFNTYRSSILASNGKDSILQIVGYYIEGSELPEIGLSRANEIRKLFPNVSDSLIQIRTAPKAQLAQAGENQYLAHEINWLAPRVVEPTDTGTSAPANDGEATRESLSGQEFIRFPTNSSQKIASSEVDAYLDDIAAWAKEFGGTIDLVGHADNRGTAENNLLLGQNRANAIQAILISKGVPAGQIRATSKGETQPTASNDTEEGMALNRRVEVSLIKN